MTNILKVANFQEVGMARQHYHLKIEAELVEKDIFAPDNWKQIAAGPIKLRVGDLVDVVKEDYSLFVQVMVVAVDKHRIFVKKIISSVLEETGAEADEIGITETGGLKILWKGPARKFCVIRPNKDGEERELAGGFVTKTEAQNYLENNK